MLLEWNSWDELEGKTLNLVSNVHNEEKKKKKYLSLGGRDEPDSVPLFAEKQWRQF